MTERNRSSAFMDLAAGDAASRDALKFLARFDLIPTPDNYQLAFHFASGERVELVRAVEAILGERGTLGAADLEQLRGRFLFQGAVPQPLVTARNQAEAILGRIIAALSAGLKDAERFDQSLADVSERLSLPVPNVASIVADLVQASRQLAERNHELEDELGRATTEIRDLRSGISDSEHAAQTDFLTALPNRLAFEAKIEDWRKLSMRLGKPLALLFIDVDGFRRVNERHGHEVGDQALRAVASALRDTVGPDAFLCRVRGEEFAVLYLGVPATDVPRHAERLRRAVETRRVRLRGAAADLEALTISLGWSTAKAGEPAAPLMARADRALFQAKRDGRNCVRVEFATE